MNRKKRVKRQELRTPVVVEEPVKKSRKAKKAEPKPKPEPEKES